MPNSKSSNIESLLFDWHGSLRISQAAHYETAKPLSRAHFLLGVPVAIISAVVGTSVFASLESTVELKWKIIIGLASILAAILASIQTFLRFEERAESHRLIAGRCAILRREIEQLLGRSSGIRPST
jgi:hypothetical protein